MVNRMAVVKQKLWQPDDEWNSYKYGDIERMILSRFSKKPRRNDRIKVTIKIEMWVFCIK